MNSQHVQKNDDENSRKMDQASTRPNEKDPTTAILWGTRLLGATVTLPWWVVVLSSSVQQLRPKLLHLLDGNQVSSHLELGSLIPADSICAAPSSGIANCGWEARRLDQQLDFPSHRVSGRCCACSNGCFLVGNLKDGRSKRLANRGENGWSSSSSEASIHRFLIWRNMVTSGSQVFRQLHQVRQSLSAGASGSRVKRRRPLTIDHHDLCWCANGWL